MQASRDLRAETKVATKPHFRRPLGGSGRFRWSPREKVGPNWASLMALLNDKEGLPPLALYLPLGLLGGVFARPKKSSGEVPLIDSGYFSARDLFRFAQSIGELHCYII